MSLEINTEALDPEISFFSDTKNWFYLVQAVVQKKEQNERKTSELG